MLQRVNAAVVILAFLQLNAAATVDSEIQAVSYVLLHVYNAEQYLNLQLRHHQHIKIHGVMKVIAPVLTSVKMFFTDSFNKFPSNENIH